MILINPDFLILIKSRLLRSRKQKTSISSPNTIRSSYYAMNKRTPSYNIPKVSQLWQNCVLRFENSFKKTVSFYYKMFGFLS